MLVSALFLHTGHTVVDEPPLVRIIAGTILSHSPQYTGFGTGHLSKMSWARTVGVALGIYKNTPVGDGPRKK